MRAEGQNRAKTQRNWQRTFSEFLVDSEVLRFGFEEFSRSNRKSETRAISLFSGLIYKMCRGTDFLLIEFYLPLTEQVVFQSLACFGRRDLWSVLG